MSLTVLVVEDTQLLRRMYSDKLTEDGYQVLQAADGLEALSVLRSATPDLVLLDLIMPNMGGLDVLQVVKKDPRLRAIPVLILTNRGEDADMEEAMSLGAADYMVKNETRPIDISERVSSILKATGAAKEAGSSYRLLVRDHEGDAGRLVADRQLTRRFWCPSCEVELNLELVANPDRPGWFDAHFFCPKCAKEY